MYQRAGVEAVKSAIPSNLFQFSSRLGGEGSVILCNSKGNRIALKNWV